MISDIVYFLVRNLVFIEKKMKEYTRVYKKQAHKRKPTINYKYEVSIPQEHDQVDTW